MSAPLMKEAPRELQLAGAVIPTPDRSTNVTIMAEMPPLVIPADDIRHFPWCDPRLCVVDEAGVEATVEHRSAPFRLEQPAGSAEVFVSQTRTVWSETDGPRRVVLDVPETTDLDELRGFNAWLRDALDDIAEMTTPLPVRAACPDWCTAAADGDERVRREHAWSYMGPWAPGSSAYYRVHRGPKGKTYRAQWEYSDRVTGECRLGRMTAGRRIGSAGVAA